VPESCRSRPSVKGSDVRLRKPQFVLVNTDLFLSARETRAHCRSSATTCKVGIAAFRDHYGRPPAVVAKKVGALCLRINSHQAALNEVAIGMAYGTHAILRALATWYATHMRRLTLASKLIGSCIIALVPSVALAEPSGGIYLLVLVWPIIAALILTIVVWRLLKVLGPGTAQNFSRMLLLAFLWTPVPSLQYPEEMLPVWPSVMYLGLSGTRLLTMTISVSVVAVLGSIVLVTRTLRQLTLRSTAG